MAVLWIHIGLLPKKTRRNSRILFSWSGGRKALSLGEVDWLRSVYTQLSPPSPPPPRSSGGENINQHSWRGVGGASSSSSSYYSYYYYYYYY